MSILYILTLIVLGIAFMIAKKSEQKLNFIKWLIIFIVSLFGYNIIIGMILGLLNITSHLLLLSTINLIFAVILSFKSIKNKKFQKYFLRKMDIISIVVVLAICTVMFFKDLYILKGDVAHFAVDSSIHYRAAKHYSDNLKIFINVEDKTFFNFNVMQPGAYINDGIMMNVIYNLTGINHVYLYQMFETLILFLSGLAFYAGFIDKIKTKRGLIGSLVLFALYIYGYPYNSWIFGFSYLSVGIAMVAMLIPVVELLYSDEKVNKTLAISLVVILATGLIFSYCLFVPAIFASICIYCFLKDFTIEGKTYLKIFKKTTLIITGLLVFVTLAGIGYLFIPTFFIEGQTNLISALKIDGAIYSEMYVNFIPYIPFAVLYCVELVKKIKNKELKYMDVFAVIMIGFYALLRLGQIAKLVSMYYMLKMNFIIWMAIFAVTIELINIYVDKKIFRLDFILFFALFALCILKVVTTITMFKLFLLLYLIIDLIDYFANNKRDKLDSILLLTLFLLCLLKGLNATKTFKYLLMFGLAFCTIAPEIINLKELTKLIPEKLKNCVLSILMKIDIRKITITGTVYVIFWGIFVCSWVWLKAGVIIGEEAKHALPNLVGIYYSENCENRKLIDWSQNLDKNEIELLTYAKENIEDLNADNIELITEGYYERIWATAMLEIDSEKTKYENFVQDTTIYTEKDALKDTSKKYIVRIVWDDLTKLETYEESIEKIKNNDKIEILFENENGYVAKINR